MLSLLQRLYAKYLGTEECDGTSNKTNRQAKRSEGFRTALVASVDTIACRFDRKQHKRHERDRAFREKIVIVVVIAAGFSGS